MKYLKGCILVLIKFCNIVMAINISKILVEYLKGSIADLVKCCWHLGNVFYFSSIYIEVPRTKLSIFLIAYQVEEVGGKRTKKSRGNLKIKHRDSCLKTKFAMLSDSEEYQNLSGRFFLVLFLSFNKKSEHFLIKSQKAGFIFFFLFS